VFAHPVVDQAISRHALDPLGIALYALTFVLVAFATRRRPVLGIVALVALDPFAFYRDIAGTTLTLPKFALLGTIVGLLLDPAVRRGAWRGLTAASARPLALGLLLVVATTALSILQAEHRIPAFRETLKAFEYLVLFATVVVAFRADPEEGAVRIALGATLGAVAILALSQEVLGAPSGLWFFNHAIPRIAGPLEGPNQLSGYLGLVLPLVAAWVLLRRPHPLEYALLGLGSMALVLTLSRAGTAAACIALGTAIVLAPSVRRGRVLSSLAAGALAGLAVLGLFGSAGLIGRFSSLAEVERPGGVGTRAELWHAAVALWRNHPFLGIGSGNFELEIAKVGPRGVRTHANCLYLQSLVEGGLPSLGATLWTVVASVASFAAGPFSEPLVVGVLAASLGLATHQIFDLLIFYPKVGALWAILLGLGVARLETLAEPVPAPVRVPVAGRVERRMGPNWGR
jgi:O-antigen ligase